LVLSRAWAQQQQDKDDAEEWGGTEVMATDKGVAANAALQSARARAMHALRDIDLNDASLSSKVVVLDAIVDEAGKLGEKVLVFSQRLRTLEFLKSHLESRGRVVYHLDGKTRDRQQLVSNFNNDPRPAVFVVSTKAGGTGLNVQGASRVIIFDFKYAPTTEEIQAIGRAYRIGQKKAVVVYWLTVATTFEESVQNISVYKKQLFSRAVDGKDEAFWATAKKTIFSPASIPETEGFPICRSGGRDSILDAVLATTAGRQAIVDVLTEEDLARGGPAPLSGGADSTPSNVLAAGQDPQGSSHLGGHSWLDPMVIDD
jgi:SNF2 family DNA or RNA helicase